jgi:DNA-binding response OmpR family regulator
MVKTKTRKKRILTVDDEPDITFALKAALEDSRFFEVDTFNDVKSALSMFKPVVYDLALLDIRMPEMDGFQLCRKLRDMDSNLKICFLTAADLAHYQKIDSDIINDLGTDCFVTKPIDNNEIVNRLRTLVSQKRP